jgi:hypothetical protein
MLISEWPYLEPETTGVRESGNSGNRPFGPALREQKRCLAVESPLVN